ncbi:MAG: hypothetical protein ACM3JB_06880 [Acidobacteriaceae bacterium]
MKVFIAADTKRPTIAESMRSELEALQMTVTNSQRGECFTAIRQVFEDQTSAYQQQVRERIVSAVKTLSAAELDAPFPDAPSPALGNVFYNTCKNDLMSADIVVAFSQYPDAAWLTVLAESANIPVLLVGQRVSPCFFAENVSDVQTWDRAKASLLMRRSGRQGLRQPSRARELHPPAGEKP